MSEERALAMLRELCKALGAPRVFRLVARVERERQCSSLLRGIHTGATQALTLPGSSAPDQTTATWNPWPSGFI